MRSVTSGFALWILCLAAAWAQAPKATLRIDKLPAEPLDAAVFDAGAASFDQPLAFIHGVSPAGFEIPAGDLLVVLRAGSGAPDLHRLQARPGAAARLEYRPGEGWSLFVRVRDARTRRPVASAAVSLGASRQETTGADGLALFSGIAAPAADAGVRHPDFVPQTVAGVSAVPGGLAFRDVTLEAGGRLRARVRLKGQPRAGALCRFQWLQQPPVEPYEVRADAQGICQPGHLPPGQYVISVLLPGTQVPLRRGVTLEDGQDLQEDFAFSEVRIHGTVTRAGSPVPGLTVRFQEREEAPGGDRVDAFAKTGPDGAYAMTLPKPASYTVGLLPAPRGPAAIERTVAVKADEDKALDFALQKITIHGAILDAQQNPIAGAWVKLSWNDDSELTQKTGKQGEFTFFLETLGTGTLTAGKEGYGDAPVQEFDLDEDAEIVPVVLILNKAGAGG